MVKLIWDPNFVPLYSVTTFFTQDTQRTRVLDIFELDTLCSRCDFSHPSNKLIHVFKSHLRPTLEINYEQ